MQLRKPIYRFANSTGTNKTEIEILQETNSSFSVIPY